MGPNTNQQNFSDEKKISIIGADSEASSYYKSPYYSPSYYFPWNPDALASGNNYNTYDDMLIDDQVKAALAIKKDMVVNTGWVIQGDRPDVNDFVTKQLENINTGTELDHCFDDVLRDILSSYGYGFSLSEPVYQIIKSKLIYKSLRTRPPHSFRFDIDAKGSIKKIIQKIVSAVILSQILLKMEIKNSGLQLTMEV